MMSEPRFSPSLDRLVDLIAKLPGLGRKSAARLALHLLLQPDENARNLAQAILDVRAKIRLCRTCSSFTEEEYCALCRDVKRDRGLICVVETPGDVLRLERTGSFRGLYHVLGGALSPLEGVGPEDLRIAQLFDRLAEDSVREIILAMNVTTDGDATALYLARELKDRGMTVSRIARGVPIGAELEHVDEATLASALEARTRIG
jgi:recombination protein RecR